jgi:hypothetical protein
MWRATNKREECAGSMFQVVTADIARGLEEEGTRAVWLVEEF